MLRCQRRSGWRDEPGGSGPFFDRAAMGRSFDTSFGVLRMTVFPEM
jgi:hypothetical protein